MASHRPPTPIALYARNLFTGDRFLENRTVIIEGTKIIDVVPKKIPGATEAAFLTPAFIDAHSHIGMFRMGEADEGNDHSTQIQPLTDPVRSVMFDDPDFVDAVDFGVLYSCIMPGSGNLFGGRSRIIRNFAANQGNAVLRDFGYKMALGYNPRSTTGWRGERPNTRMGVYALLERRFDEVLLKEKRVRLQTEKKRYELGKKKLSTADIKREERFIVEEEANEWNREEQALLDVLHRRTPVKVHVHKEDDAMYLLALVDKYKLDISAEHTLDFFRQEPYDLLKRAGIPVVIGPLGTTKYKVELANESWKNLSHVIASGVQYGLMTDHPVIFTTALRDHLKYFLINGVSEVDALSVITKRNAEVLRVQDLLGSIKKGYLASVLTWDQHPLFLGSHPRMVIGEGKVLRG
jgi:imidazolonepropionase-like amidohydrolase